MDGVNGFFHLFGLALCLFSCSITDIPPSPCPWDGKDEPCVGVGGASPLKKAKTPVWHRHSSCRSAAQIPRGFDTKSAASRFSHLPTRQYLRQRGLSVTMDSSGLKERASVLVNGGQHSRHRLCSSGGAIQRFSPLRAQLRTVRADCLAP